MRWFSDLFEALSENGNQEVKLNLIRQFFIESDPDEKMRGLFLLSGRKIKRPVSSSALRQIITDSTGIGNWLLAESEKSTGNLAETLTLLIDDPKTSTRVSLKTLFEFCETCRTLSSFPLSDYLTDSWKGFNRNQRLLANQLLCGSYKPGYSAGLIILLISEATHVNHAAILHLLSEKWHPDSLTFDDLKNSPENSHPIAFPVTIPKLIKCRNFPPNPDLWSDWHAEWKLSGKEIQLVKSSGKVILFDHDGSPLHTGFSELFNGGLSLPDGTILVGTVINQSSIFMDPDESESQFSPDEKPRPEKEKKDAVLICSDILAFNGHSQLNETYQKRRIVLETCLHKLQSEFILLSEPLSFKFDDFHSQPIPMGTDGILLKSSLHTNLSGWLLLPAQKLIKSVLLYVQASPNSTQGIYDELTMAVWKDELLITVGKVKNTLSGEENRELSKFVKANTLERFGPVRTVKPELIFEVLFDSVHFSKRHKTGLVLKEPVLVKWIKGAGLEEVSRLSDLEEMAKKSLRTRDTEA